MDCLSLGEADDPSVFRCLTVMFHLNCLFQVIDRSTGVVYFVSDNLAGNLKFNINSLNEEWKNREINLIVRTFRQVKTTLGSTLGQADPAANHR